MTTKPCFALVACLALSSCALGGEREPPDAAAGLADVGPGDAEDVGFEPGLDAGQVIDAGAGADVGAGLDAGAGPDTGAGPGPDAALPDAAAPGLDAGTITGAPRWTGRVDATNASAVKFAWQGAGLVATVNGTTVGVKLRTEGTSTVFFKTVVDGTPALRFEVTSGADRTVTLASGLSAGDHLIELYRETEGMYGMSTFLGFTAGTVKGAPAASGRLIEVVGDSISAGYGNLGTEPHPGWVANPACHWTAENSSWFATYAAVAGRALNAEVSTLARSGWGMYRDNTGSITGVLSSVWGKALGTGNAAAWGFGPQPNAVVVNLGTNDWAKGDPGAAYETAYIAFLQQVRTKYPDAWIFCTIGSMLGQPELGQVKARLAAVVAARSGAGDTKVSTFDFGTQDMGPDGSVPTGCDWHPNVADNARMAEILKTQLKAKLGW